MGCGITDVDRYSAVGGGSGKPRCALAVLHFAQRGEEDRGFRIFEQGLADYILRLFRVLLFEKDLGQACGQRRIVRLLEKLRLIERDGAIVGAVEKELVRFRGCVGRDFTANRPSRGTYHAGHESERDRQAST